MTIDSVSKSDPFVGIDRHNPAFAWPEVHERATTDGAAEAAKARRTAAALTQLLVTEAERVCALDEELAFVAALGDE